MPERSGRRWVLERVPGSGEICAVADEGRLTQALMNLAANAARYSTDGDEVAFGIERDGAFIALWVRDEGRHGSNGHGPDRRAILACTRLGAHRESTGLGLAIAAAIARAHGGTIDVVSAPAAGSTFTVKVPFVAPPAHSEGTIQ